MVPEMRAARRLLLCVMLSSAGTVLSAPPVLKPISNPVVSVKETETRERTLVKGITCSDPDGDVTRVFVESIQPTHSCGNCFHVWPCEKGKGYCLMFTPDLGRLHYDGVTSYIVQVTCTDDVESEVSSRIVDVQLIANSAPVFTTPGPRGASFEIKHAAKKRAGDLVYDVDADDVDNDVIFYSMVSEPSTEFFDIGYADGKIHVTQDLRQLCQDNVTFRVMAADSHHAPVGPVVLRAFLKSRNHRPVITNSKRAFVVPEKKSFSFKVDVDDADDDDVIFKLRAVPEQGLEYYAIDKKGTVKTRKKPDYENALLRTVDLYIDVTDGFCDAETFHVTIRITDVNEAPVIRPDFVERTVYEGFISMDPGWRVEDPDEHDVGVWHPVYGAGGHLVIDPTTGLIHSRGELDIDPDPHMKFNFKVQVKDKGHNRDTAVVRLTVLDKNDHVPVFQQHLYRFSASPCTRVGAVLGFIHARDHDSHFQGNRDLVYGGSGGAIAVLATGKVVLRTPCQVGVAESVEGRVTDQGTFPGPLSGVPATVSLRCTPCPDPTTTGATDATTGEVTTPAIIDDTEVKTSIWAWIVPAILLALSLAGLLVYVISKRCHCACAKRCRPRRVLRKIYPQKTKEKSKPPPSNTSTSSPKDLSVVEVKPAPPVLPPPEGESYLFGFWKETYVDRDQRHMPRRDVIPASVEQDRAVEEKEREEEEKEKRRLERQKLEEKYQAELKKYHKEQQQQQQQQQKQQQQQQQPLAAPSNSTEAPAPGNSPAPGNAPFGNDPPGNAQCGNAPSGNAPVSFSSSSSSSSSSSPSSPCSTKKKVCTVL
ncbi:protocadherin-like protein [Babylonia areolata]|uniref:protocadherin-like protein n=1 Tax=Babylonia areolata TaxID=304850 RepID=UPI003FD2486D